MFGKLMFIDEALNSIFNIETVSCHNFSGTNESPNIQECDYKKLIDYFEHKTELDLKVLIGGLNLLAYGHIKNKEPLIKYVKNFSEQIFMNLDAIVPNIDGNFDKRTEQYYKDIINAEFSYNLLKSIDIAHYNILTNGNYGLTYLLVWLAENCYLDFEEWHLQTTRKDLKVYFAYIVMYNYKLIFSKSSCCTKSKISWLKAYCILSRYNISRFISHGKGAISEIISSSLDDKEKLDILIFYLFKNYTRFDGNFENKEQLLQDLNLFQQINWQHLFTVDYLKSINLWLGEYYILNEIIKLIECKSTRISLYDYILEKIELYLEKDLPTGHEILLSNVYGQIISDYGELVISATEDKYNTIKNLLLKPYSYHRNKEQWKLNICKLMFYTIALYIVNITNAVKCKNLIDTFINAKNELPHYLDKDINSFMAQLQQQLPRQ